MRRYDKVADALVDAYRTGEESAMRIVWDYFGHRRAWDGMRRYVRLDLGRTEQPQSGEDDTITLAEAQCLVARAQGFESWESARGLCGIRPARKDRRREVRGGVLRWRFGIGAGRRYARGTGTRSLP